MERMKRRSLNDVEGEVHSTTREVQQGGGEDCILMKSVCVCVEERKRE